jgi:hypothetical protein
MAKSKHAGKQTGKAARRAYWVTLAARPAKRDFRWFQFVEDFDMIVVLKGGNVFLRLINEKFQITVFVEEAVCKHYKLKRG